MKITPGAPNMPVKSAVIKFTPTVADEKNTKAEFTAISTQNPQSILQKTSEAGFIFKKKSTVSTPPNISNKDFTFTTP